MFAKKLSNYPHKATTGNAKNKSAFLSSQPAKNMQLNDLGAFTQKKNEKCSPVYQMPIPHTHKQKNLLPTYHSHH